MRKSAHALVEWFRENFFGGSMSCDIIAIVHNFRSIRTKETRILFGALCGDQRVRFATENILRGLEIIESHLLNEILTAFHAALGPSRLPLQQNAHNTIFGRNEIKLSTEILISALKFFGSSGKLLLRCHWQMCVSISLKYRVSSWRNSKSNSVQNVR